MRIFPITRRGAYRGVLWAAIVAALLRALVPIGYMVAFQGDALAIVPCAGVVMHSVADASADHFSHHANHGTRASTKTEKHDKTPFDGAHYSACPFATSCCSVMAALAPTIAAPADFSAQFVTLLPSLPEIKLTKIFQARAPPTGF